MTDTLQKKFEDLRKGDRVLVEVIVRNSIQLENRGYICAVTSEHDSGQAVYIARDSYRGCLTPEPKALKVGMRFRFKDDGIAYQIYDVSEGRVHYFHTRTPLFTYQASEKIMAADSSIEWIEEEE